MQPLLSEKILSVIPNPFASPLDGKGNPVAFVAYDPEYLPKGTIRYIGATLDRKVNKPRNITALRESGDQRQYSRTETRVLYKLAPENIVHSVYHHQLVRDGALLPCDEDTAHLCGIPFVDPAEVLEASISERIREWCMLHPGETLTPAKWLEAVEENKPPILMLGPVTLARREAVTATSMAERIAARKEGKKLMEGDGLEKKEVKGTDLGPKNDGPKAPPTPDATDAKAPPPQE